MRAVVLFCVFFLPSLAALAQSGIIKGRVFDPITNEGIPFANVVIQNTTTGSTTDIDGYYEINNLEPGIYNIQATYIGYKNATAFEIRVSTNRPAIVDLEMEENIEQLDAVVVKASPFNKTQESPVSLRNIGADEIRRNPGGNRDISRAVQSLPGVASTPNFRNDILIRGGSPAENVFYLDGIEIPTINHFATQGASGGPQGIINVDFLKEVDFYAGAFPASRGDALSSVFDFKFIEGNPDKMEARFTLGSSDAGLTIDGPLGKNTNYILSVRRSYLQYLFKVLELPFLPVYNDLQFKVKHKINDKNTLTFLGIGGLDDLTLNIVENPTESQQIALDAIPVNDQYNYTLGAKYTNFRKNSYTNVVLSHSHLNNNAKKYQGNDESTEDNVILDYASDEIETKFRVENVSRIKGFKITAGANLERASYKNDSYIQREIQGSVFEVDYASELSFNKYGLFANVSRGFFGEAIVLSAGFRTDAAGYSDETNNILEQFSPRVSLTYNFAPRWSLNFNTGIYYQLPPYTILGYRENDVLVNKENNIQYMRNKHAVAGIEWQGAKNTRISLEGFFKDYDQYPFVINDSISFANLGGDFGVSGDEPMSSISEGRTYGMELLVQQKLLKGFYGILAYTFSWSEFEGKNGNLIPTAWDSRHIINLTAGKKFKRNWEIGAQFRYTTALPYTPFDVNTSALVNVWDATGEGILNYEQINTLRLGDIHALDLRVDKKWFFERWNLNLYLDIENVYGSQSPQPDLLTVARDENGNELYTDETQTSYQLKTVDNSSGVVLPTIGVVVEF